MTGEPKIEYRSAHPGSIAMEENPTPAYPGESGLAQKHDAQIQRRQESQTEPKGSTEKRGRRFWL